MVVDFEEGKEYICIHKTRPIYFNSEGKMDFLLDGKPHKVIKKGYRTDILFEEATQTWKVQPRDFKLKEQSWREKLCNNTK